MENLKNYEKNIGDKINLYNISFKKHYFNHEQTEQNKFRFYNFKSFDDNELYNFVMPSNNQRLEVINNKINKLDKTNITQLLKFVSFNCKHLLHDEIWLKFTKNNFVCDMEDDYKEIYCNTINKSDVKTKEFIDFIAKLEKFDYNVRLLDFDENDNEDYNNDLLLWVVIPIPL
jgi:hypothetical protein